MPGSSSPPALASAARTSVGGAPQDSPRRPFRLPGLKRAVSRAPERLSACDMSAPIAAISMFGNGEAHLDGSDLQQLHHRNARQHRLAGRSPPLADHTVERSVQRAVAQVLLGDSKATRPDGAGSALRPMLISGRLWASYSWRRRPQASSAAPATPARRRRSAGPK